MLSGSDSRPRYHQSRKGKKMEDLLIVNPLSTKGTKERIEVVLHAIAGQGGHDGYPWDQIQEAGDYIDTLKARLKPITAVYEKFKHLDAILNDASVLEGDSSPQRKCLYELWMAVKAAETDKTS